jgi:hypothetical protein
MTVLTDDPPPRGFPTLPTSGESEVVRSEAGTADNGGQLTLLPGPVLRSTWGVAAVVRAATHVKSEMPCTLA